VKLTPGLLDGLPERVTLEQVVAACRALGIRDTDTVVSVTITPQELTVAVADLHHPTHPQVAVTVTVIDANRRPGWSG
jgi:hypothetical protein